MIIQLGPKEYKKAAGWGGRQPAKNLKSSCRMMIEKVMIQLGVHFNRKGGGGGHQRGTCDAEDAGSQGRKPTEQRMRKAKPESRQKPQSQKAICRSGTGNAEDAKRQTGRNCECRGCEMKTIATKTHVKATKTKKPKSHPP